MIELERTPDGRINNCALANFDEESNCQVCHGTCPDRERLAVEGFAVTDHSKTKIGKWLEKARADLDQYVRPEIQALAKRGNVTPAEVAELRINSWEWEHLTPAMNDEALVALVERYNEAVGLFAPELLRRFKRLISKDEPCFSCKIEADIGSEENPHPVPACYHTCKPIESANET